jgi:hypothetical protein
MNSLDLDHDHIEIINLEQKKRIEIHKWITSEKAGRDLGDEAILEWVEKYAPVFREWAESLPYTCVHCGCCNGPNGKGLCPKPFDPIRLKFLEQHSKELELS